MSATDVPSGMQGESEFQDKEFQAVLEALLNSYRPILEAELRLSQSPADLLKEAASHPPSCDDEIALADRVFDKFFTEKVAPLLLSTQAREQFGPISEWRWCWQHILCCLKFGWLIQRARTFDAAAYYLNRFWRCVRQAVGQSTLGELSVQDRADLASLTEALAQSYKPFLAEQLQSIAAASRVADEVLAGKINCEAGLAQSDRIFDSLLTFEHAPALFGKEAYERLSHGKHFWFCRCWCLCTIKFGFCLSRAKSLIDVVWCLLAYIRCIRDCFQPLTCQITHPTGCVEEQLNPKVGGMAVVVVGTAIGALFDHYTLQWRHVQGQACDDDTDWSSAGVVYPGGGATGTIPVVNGTLGWLNTTVLSPSSYDVRLCVYPSQGMRLCCCIQFSLFKRLVWIDRVAISPGAPVQTPPGPFVSTAPIVNINPGGIVVPVGGCITVKGSAYVGDCNQRKIKCFDLRWGIGHLPGPGEVGFNPAAYSGSLLVPYGPVCYVPPDEADKRAPWNEVIERALTTHLVQTTVDLGGGITITVWKLQDFCFDSTSLLPTSVNAGGCPDPHHRCRSGKYTLLLQVEDTLGNLYYDTQQVWFDNKPISVEFDSIEGLPSCSDLHLRTGTPFVPPGAPCTVPWPVGLQGIAYDEYIDETDLPYPSDNFDSYSLYITRQGGPTLVVPITPNLIAYGPNPLLGTQRVGDPGTRCELLPPVGGCPPPPPAPVRTLGQLTKLDLRIFDAVCAPSIPASEHYTIPAGFSLKRGECCGYVLQLYAQDKTWSDGYAGGLHNAWSLPWPVCICNDLP